MTYTPHIRDAKRKTERRHPTNITNASAPYFQTPQRFRQRAQGKLRLQSKVRERSTHMPLDRKSHSHGDWAPSMCSRIASKALANRKPFANKVGDKAGVHGDATNRPKV